MTVAETKVDIPLEQQVPLAVLTGSLRLKILSNPVRGDMTGLDPKLRQSDPLIDVDLPSIFTELTRRIGNMDIDEVAGVDQFIQSTIEEATSLGKPIVRGIYDLGKAIATQNAYFYRQQMEQGYD